MERRPSVQTTQYPLIMMNPILPYLLLFVGSSDTTVQTKAASILQAVTSVSMSECLSALHSVDCAALLADIELCDTSRFRRTPPDFSAASTLIGDLSTLFTDPAFSSTCVDTVKLLTQIVSSLLTSEDALKNMGNCLPLTLLVMTLTAAPSSHHLRILTIFLEFSAKCLTSIVPPNAPIDNPLIVTLSKLRTKLATPSSLWYTLVALLSPSNPSSNLALCLLTIINTGRKASTFPILHHQDGPRIAPLLLQDLDELELSLLLSLLGRNADDSTGVGLGEEDAQQIVERLLVIEQRHPLHPHTQHSHPATPSEGTTLPPRIDRTGEADASTRTNTSVGQVVDVWRVMGMVVSSLARSPSGLERLQVLYPLVFERLKARGASLFRKDEQAERTRERLLAALVRVCSELVPLLRTVDFFPLVHLVSSFLNSILHPADGHPHLDRSRYSLNLLHSFDPLNEFFLRLDEVTQGLDEYDINRHDIFFTPLSAEDVSTGEDYVVSRPIPLLQFFVEFEVKCIGVEQTALLQQNNPTVSDQTRRQLLLHLLATMKKTNELDPEAAVGVLWSFRGLPPGTGQLIDTLKDVILVASINMDLYFDSPEFNTSGLGFLGLDQHSVARTFIFQLCAENLTLL
ncbi:hypothetical protein BLNAU_13869 [Blattamonas nauphoetae]|uniref:Uncharacterized protein n=1 Tax=Blattamonas nauphoetae TaxID=2049346 RepID=A0ABQ9XFL5_9EUKA|nr:hypothetical protein BLNAU_13869 [Blattamonas nauphoetae]